MTTLLMQTAFKLVSFFKNLGVDYVFDVTLGRDLALLEKYFIGSLWSMTTILCIHTQCKGVHQQIQMH